MRVKGGNPRDAFRTEISIPRVRAFYPHPSSLIPHPSSLIPHPSSLIPHPSSLIPHPSSLIPHPSSLESASVSVLNPFAVNPFAMEIVRLPGQYPPAESLGGITAQT